MTRHPRNQAVCPVCREQKSSADLLPGDLVRDAVLSDIQAAHPTWTPADSICLKCLNRYRAEHVHQLLEQEKGELTALEEQVIASLSEQETIARNVNVQFDLELTFGERMSDRLADFGGSWKFLISFSLMVVGWVCVNAFVLATQPFDPYPFILLNLVLSCLAAVQAPIIMMSQNRQEAKDRLRSEHDYRVDLKAELEIRILTAKLDQLLSHQWRRLLEIQQLQLDLMEDIAERGMRKVEPQAQKPLERHERES